MAPIGAGAEEPPARRITQWHRPRRPFENKRAGVCHVGAKAGIVGGIGRNLGNRAVSGRFDEAGEISVRHRILVDLEGRETNTPLRPFFGIEAITAHAKDTARQAHHLARWGYAFACYRHSASPPGAGKLAPGAGNLNSPPRSFARK